MPKLSTQEPINIFELVVPMNPNDPEFMSKNNIALRLEQVIDNLFLALGWYTPHKSKFDEFFTRNLNF